VIALVLRAGSARAVDPDPVYDDPVLAPYTVEMVAGLPRDFYRSDSETRRRFLKAEEAAMAKIETEGLYALVARTPVDWSVSLANGRGDWIFEREECFPFLGYTKARNGDLLARVPIGLTWSSIPAECIVLRDVRKTPSVRTKYQAMMKEDRALEATRGRCE
jgi:hypothetical protein